MSISMCMRVLVVVGKKINLYVVVGIINMRILILIRYTTSTMYIQCQVTDTANHAKSRIRCQSTYAQYSVHPVAYTQLQPHFLRGTTFQGLSVEDWPVRPTPNALCTASPDWAGAFAAPDGRRPCQWLSKCPQLESG